MAKYSVKSNYHISMTTYRNGKNHYQVNSPQHAGYSEINLLVLQNSHSLVFSVPPSNSRPSNLRMPKCAILSPSSKASRQESVRTLGQESLQAAVPRQPHSGQKQLCVLPRQLLMSPPERLHHHPGAGSLTPLLVRNFPITWMLGVHQPFSPPIP